MTNFSEGLNLEDLDQTSEAEITASLMHVWSWRGATYEFGVKSLMFDYAPAFAKMHRRGADVYGRPELENILTLSIQNIQSYVNAGWETGILNEFVTLQRHGLSKERVMELVMFAQLYAGVRGLGHVVRAVGDYLPALAAPTVEPAWPAGWAPDQDAIRAGLDYREPHMTAGDSEALIAWWERTIGTVPESVQFGLKYHPDFVKANRGKWETAIQTLPKQVIPWQMIRQNMTTGSEAGLRESVLLARSWGISRDRTIRGITSAAYYCTGPEGLYTAQHAVADILDDWDA